MITTKFKYDTSTKSIIELISLKNKIAVVIGGSKGTGYAIAERLAEAGATIVIADLNLLNADIAAQKIAKKYTVNTASFSLDSSDRSSMAALVKHTTEKYGQLDIWVNNADICPYMQALELTNDDKEKVMDQNMRGIFWGSSEAARQMAESGNGGVIINLTSGITYNNNRTISEHLAAKYGIVGLTKAFAYEMGNKGVRVLAVAPSTMESFEANNNNTLPVTAEKATQVKTPVPLGRTAIADDIARVVLFCASGLSMFMTGAVLTVDGGEIYF